MTRRNCQHAFEEEVSSWNRSCIYCNHKIFKKSTHKQILYVFGPEEKEKELRTYTSCVNIGTKTNTQTNMTRGVLTLENPNNEEDVIEYECDAVLFQVSIPKLLSSFLKTVTSNDDNSFELDEIIHKPNNFVAISASSPGKNCLDNILLEEGGLISCFYKYIRNQISTVKKHQFTYVIEFGFCQLPLNSETVIDLLSDDLISESRERINPDTLKNVVIYNGFKNISLDFDKGMKGALRTVHMERINDRLFNLMATFVVKKFSTSRKACLLTNRFDFFSQNFFSKKELYEQNEGMRKNGVGDFGNDGTRTREEILSFLRSEDDDRLQNGRRRNNRNHSRFELLFNNSVFSYLVKRKLSIVGENKNMKVVNLGIISGNVNFYEQTRKIIEYLLFCKEATKSLIHYYN